MKSHDLARILLENPNLEVAVQANNHTYLGGSDSFCGLCKVGVLESYAGQHIIIGNISKKNINKPNWYISDMIHGDAPDEWR